MTLPAASSKDAVSGAKPTATTQARLLSAWTAWIPLVLPALAGLAAVLGIWEAWVHIADVEAFLVPPPSAVAERLYADPWLYSREGLNTLEGALLGFLVGGAFAISMATLMAQSRLIERALFPLAILIKVTPIVAIAPLLTIWFGFGLMPKVFIAALIVFFPIMVNALIGFRSVDANALALLESLAASRREIFWHLRLPSSLPYLFAAFRVSIPLSVIGAVVAEWFSGDRGLGSVIFIANNNVRMPTAFAGIFTLALIGVGLFLITAALERRILFWHESSMDVR